MLWIWSRDPVTSRGSLEWSKFTNKSSGCQTRRQIKTSTPFRWRHNSAMASQITSLTFVYSTVYSGADQRKHQSSASLAFVWGIHRRPMNSPHKWPVTRKMFPFDDVIMHLLHWRFQAAPYQATRICDNSVGLTHEWLQTHGCVLSTVGTDALGLKHQAISIHSVNSIIIVLDQFHTEIVQF